LYPILYSTHHIVSYVQNCAEEQREIVLWFPGHQNLQAFEIQIPKKLRGDSLSRLTIGEETMFKMHLRPSLEGWRNRHHEIVRIGNNDNESSRKMLEIARQNKEELSRSTWKRKGIVEPSDSIVKTGKSGQPPKKKWLLNLSRNGSQMKLLKIRNRHWLTK